VNRFDLIVIGGGVIGCSVAYHAARKRARVLIVDRSGLAGRAYLVAAGMLAAQEEASEPGALFDVSIASRGLFANLAEDVRAETGIDPELEFQGVWRIAGAEAERDELRRKMDWQAAAGWKAEWVEPEALAKALPAVRARNAGAVYFPQDGQIDSAKWTRALAEGARLRGARLVENVTTLGLWTEAGRVLGVKTDGEAYTADRVVLTAGAWTASLLEPLGWKLPLAPVKGQVLALEGFPRLFAAPVFFPDGYFTPKASGRLIVGATMENAGFDVKPTLAAQRDLAEKALRWCPELSGRQVLGMEAGLRPATPDRLPVMGPVPGWKNLFVCTGHFRNGILLSPYSGAAMAEGMLDGVWDPRAAAFSAGRFLEGVSR
jgi:glycine oxidase